MGAAISANSLHPVSTDESTIKLESEHIYNPGENVCGTVHLKSSDDEVTIDLIGEIGYTVLLSSDYEHETKDYVDHKIFFKNSILIKDKEKFCLHLKEDLPPALNLVIGTYPCIRYYLQVNLTKTNQYRHYIMVCPLVNIPQSIVRSQSFDSTKHRGINLTGSIDVDYVLPGQTLKIHFKIENPHRRYIKQIRGKICMKGEFKKAEHYERVMTFTAEHLNDTDNEQITDDVSVRIPSRYLPPTFSYINEEHEFQVDINYSITLEMYVRGLINPISTNIPLFMGFIPENIIFNDEEKPNYHRRNTFHHMKNNPRKLFRRHTRH